MAAALVGMVGRLNDKKDGTPGPLHHIIASADALVARLHGLVQEDADAFSELAESWKLASDDLLTAARKQAATIRATETPLEIMARALDVMLLAIEGLETSKKNCLSDPAAAAILAHAALETARLNVMINLPGLSEPQHRDAFRSRADHLRAQASSLRRRIDTLITANYP